MTSGPGIVTLQSLAEAWASRGDTESGHRLARLFDGLGPATVRSYRVAMLRFWQWYAYTHPGKPAILPREVDAAIAQGFLGYMRRAVQLDSYIVQQRAGDDRYAEIYGYIQRQGGVGYATIRSRFGALSERKLLQCLRALLREHRILRSPKLAEIRSGQTDVQPPPGEKIDQAGITFALQPELFRYRVRSAKGMSLATQRLWLGHLSSVWVAFGLTENPWLSVRHDVVLDMEQRARTPRGRMTSETFERVLATTAGESLRDRRDRVVMLLLGELGMRSGAVKRARWQDLELTERTRLGGREFSDRLGEAVVRLRQALIESGAPDRADAASRLIPPLKLWGPNARVNQSGRGVSSAALVMMIERRALEAGFDRAELGTIRANAEGVRWAARAGGKAKG